MKDRETRKRYVEPRILATYRKEELQELIKPHGAISGASGCGCGGCGS
jgi:hypothetical protein